MFLSCPGGKTFGQMTKNNLIEIKCNSRFCKTEKNYVVFHYYSTLTGELVNTEKYKQPMP